MIGNNDWLDYMEYRDYIAHSMGMWDKSKVKYKDKIPVGGGKFRYIYDEPRNPRGGRRMMEPRTVQQQRAMGRSGGMTRTPTSSRQASRSVSFRDRGNQIRAGRDAERRDMERQGMQNRMVNNQQIEANKLARGYANQQRAAQQQMTQNRMATDAAMSQKPKNLFDHMGNALNAAGRMAGDAARGVGNWVGDRAREVGEAASGAWNNVTGGDGRLDLDDVRRGADSVLRGAGRAIGLEARSNLDAARNREDVARQMRDIRRVENEAANDPNVGKSEESKAGYRDRYTQAAQEHGAASRDLREAQRAYDNTLAGKVENTANAAGNWLGDAARNVGDWFGDRAKDVGDWVGDRAADARDAVSGMVDQAGRSLGSVYDQMRGREDGSTWNNITGGDGHFNYEDVGNVANAAGRRAQNVGNWIGDRAADFRDNVSGAVDALGARAGSAYDRMAGREDGTTWNNITGGDNHFNYGDVQNVANAVGRRAQNLYDQAGNAIGGVGDFIGDRAADTRDAVSGVVDNAGRRLGSVYDRMSGREDGTTWNRVTGGDDHFNYEDVGNAMNAAGREAQNIGRGVAQRVGNLAGDIRDVASDTVDRAGRRLGSAYDQMTGRENGSTWNTVTGGDNHFNYGDVGNLASAAGREARNALGNVSSAARSLIETAGGNIVQALTLAQQRLRYAQNTGNPQMERDAQAIMRELENLPQQRL